MQTFVPWPGFADCAAVLDTARREAEEAQKAARRRSAAARRGWRTRRARNAS